MLTKQMCYIMLSPGPTDSTIQFVHIYIEPLEASVAIRALKSVKHNGHNCQAKRGNAKFLVWRGGGTHTHSLTLQPIDLTGQEPG